jgi:cytochrome c-type biogenesis protein CcmH/NrfG
LQHPNEKIERSLFKAVAWTVGIIVLLVAGGMLGHRSFRNWQQRRLIAQANALVNEGDFKRASLNARRVLQINPESAEACRILARLAERTGLRAAVDWRRRVMDLGAANTEDLLALARDAIRFEDRPIADVAISRLPESAKQTAEYHALMADVAFAQRDAVEMERHLNEALRIEPTNKDYIMRLAALRLGANDPMVRARGRATLTELQGDRERRRDAIRYLAEDAMRHSDFTGALELAQELDRLPEKIFTDRLVLLSALKAARDPGFQAFLKELQTATADDSERLASVITWMNMHEMPAEAIAWSAKLPAAVTNGRFVPVALSDSYVATHDWAGLLRLTKSGNWGNLNFLRNALFARALRETGQATDSAAAWNEAVKEVTGNTRYMLLLFETVEKWGWRAEAIDLLWLAAKDPVKGDEALQTLYRYFARNGDTENLYRVLLHRAELRPEDRNVQNNFAQLSLLLNLNITRAQRIAHDLYEKEPKNAAYASTYAFALYSQGETKQALKILNGLTDEQLHQPEVAAYYGVFLAAAGDQARALEFLDLAEKATLLPEEKTLVEKARRSLAQR